MHGMAGGTIAELITPLNEHVSSFNFGGCAQCTGDLKTCNFLHISLSQVYYSYFLVIDNVLKSVQDRKLR